MTEDALPDWLRGGGAMADRIRAVDWAATPLGPLEGWPQSLRTVVNLMLSSPGVMSLVWGPEGIHLYNDACSALLQEEGALALGRSVFETFARSRDAFAGHLAAGMAGGSARLRGQRYPVLRGGKLDEAWFDVDYAPVHDETGQVAGVLWTLTETTAQRLAETARDALRAAAIERARSEAALREREADLARVQRIGGVGGLDIDLANGIDGWRSPEYRALHGLPPDVTRETHAQWRERVHPEDRTRAEATLFDALSGDGGSYDSEYRIIRPSDGALRWIHARADIMRDAEGRALRLVGAHVDVTEQKLAQDALRDSEERHRADLERQVSERTAELKASRDLLRATMDSSTDMIQVFEAIRGESGDIVDFKWVLNNNTSKSRYGDVKGESLLKRNPGVVEEGIFGAFKRAVETGEPSQSERHYVHEQFDGWFYQSIVKLGDGVATTTKDITAWKAAQAEVLRLQGEVAEAKLHESEERLRQFGEASQNILWIRDAAALQWRYLTPAFETIYGLRRSEALTGDTYRSWMRLIVPEDRSRVNEAMRRVRAGERVSFEYRIRRPSDGTIRWLRDTDFPIRDDKGVVTLIGGIGHDVTTAKQSQEWLEQNEERLRSAVEVGKLGLWDWNVATGDVHWSDEHFRMEGYAVGEVVPSYETWTARIHPDDRAATEAALHEARDGRREYIHEFRTLHPDGTTRWLSARGRFFYDAAGAPVRMIGAMIDTTERRNWEETQKVMMAELQHRTRNLLGVVRSIASQTLAASDGLASFEEAFNDRLTALSRVQGLLSRADQEPITIGAVLRLELDALGAAAAGTRVTLAGPEVRLRNSVVQTLALAVHELATNARKYGALASESGRLSVTWRLSGVPDGARSLNLAWVEESAARFDPSAGATVGYGRELIERALPYALGARTSYALDATGVRCTIDMPLDRRPAGRIH